MFDIITKILVKKIRFSTYVSFSALFGASTGLLMVAMLLLMFPFVLSSTPKEELWGILPIPFFFLFSPLISTLSFGMYGVISYPFYLLISKIFKKFTLEVELLPIEYQSQSSEQNISPENDIDIIEDETDNITKE